MRESFVIHAEYIEDLPEESKDVYLHYIYNYGIYDSEPAGLDGFEKSIWIKIKRRIDQDRQSYEERKEKNRKRQEEWRRKQGMTEETPAVEPVAETTSDKEIPYIFTPAQTDYSKTIFTLFSEAGLPCQKNNEISFLQTDFYNAMSIIHRSQELKGIHSDDVIQAVQNYITVLNDPECYVTTKMSFYKLVQSKMFYNFLPANFDKANFKKFSSNKTEKTATEPEQKKWYEDRFCTKCSQKKIFWNNDTNCYVCDSCGKTYKLGEI